MNRIEKFEDILSWQKARLLTQRIYGMTKREMFPRDFPLKDQGYILEQEFSEVRENTLETSKLISGMMAYIAASNMRGKKFNRD